MDTPILKPMTRYEAAINSERLINEAHHAYNEGRYELAKLILMEAQIYATLAIRRATA